MLSCPAAAIWLVDLTVEVRHSSFNLVARAELCASSLSHFVPAVPGLGADQAVKLDNREILMNVGCCAKHCSSAIYDSMRAVQDED